MRDSGGTLGGRAARAVVRKYRRTSQVALSFSGNAVFLPLIPPLIKTDVLAGLFATRESHMLGLTLEAMVVGS